MEAVLIAAAAVSLAASVPIVARVKAEYEGDGVLSDATVVAVWVLYVAIGGVTILAAALGIWRIDLPAVLSVGGGVAALAVGLVLEVWGLASMASIRRMSGLQPDHLIAHGAFRYSRNPQNVGIAIFMVGVALLGESALALLATAGFWVIFRVYVGFEEAHLSRTFGTEYDRYRNHTPRFLGMPG